MDGQTSVEYLPFLVVVRPLGAKEDAVWLPYWHRVSDNGHAKLKYGQWAPYMDSSMFHDLVQRAQKQGWGSSQGQTTA
jgi:hypothetical protein